MIFTLGKAGTLKIGIINSFDHIGKFREMYIWRDVFMDCIVKGCAMFYQSVCHFCDCLLLINAAL